ncbi:CopD family protein [Sphingomonas aerophila]|jgi:putative membrane protein|uniref:Protoporphyrinogen IX oxidase n=1 Tax=Sphingomonas aerophila TaxID=1344948 RepID=A0A7W9EVQ4_9SPHN|nr:CopD family protein [Sphingomonas aerophila]MBB5716569.1 putative membrane protein [Sphingomonas aerophila]
MSYQAVLALHLLAITLFLGGHVATVIFLAGTGADGASDAAELRRLALGNRLIVAPALAIVWIAGLHLADAGNWFPMRWLQIKIVCVVLLTASHIVLSLDLERAAAGARRRRLRWWLLPFSTILVLVIIGLVTVKPS